MLLQNFLTNINKNLLFDKEDFLLVAVSGGIDSVVLTHLLHEAKFRFAIVHANFSLREKDADEDEQFVLQLAKKYHAPCFCKKWDTLKYAKDNNLSVQMAARILRYNWFDELMKMHAFDYLLTAHHADDNIETILLNQLRSTGIKGLKGIPLKSGRVVRPLLPFTKTDILDYANTTQLKFREDISNYSDKYQRNFLRLHIIPLMKQLQPSLNKIFQNNIENFSVAESVTSEYAEIALAKCVEYDKEVIRINKENILLEKHFHFVLHYLLSKYQFNDEQISDIAVQFFKKNSSGKKFYSSTHTLMFDRKYVFLISTKTPVHHQEYIANNILSLNLYSGQYHFEQVKCPELIEITDKKCFYIETAQLKFPLKIRHWKYGDTFMLLGTNHSKKLSDIFIDKKVPLYMKNKIILLCNADDEIIWISHLGLINNRYKITQHTRFALKISVCE